MSGGSISYLPQSRPGRTEVLTRSEGPGSLRTGPRVSTGPGNGREEERKFLRVGTFPVLLGECGSESID